jgi:hypothetical protein
MQYEDFVFRIDDHIQKSNTLDAENASSRRVRVEIKSEEKSRAETVGHSSVLIDDIQTLVAYFTFDSISFKCIYCIH